MKKRILIWASIVSLLIGGAIVWEHLHPSTVPLLEGKTVQDWLETPDPQLDVILPSSHPLALAGPEIIPSLIDAIERNYRLRVFLDRNRRKLPGFIQNRLPERKNFPGAIRTVAAFRLGQFGATASNAVPTLIRLLKDPRQKEFSVRKSRVIQALGDIGPPAKEAIPILVDYLSHTNSFTRHTSVTSLLEIGSVPSEAVPVLKQHLTGPGFWAANAAIAIWIAEPNAESFDRLKEMLSKKQDYNTRAHMAEAFRWVDSIPDELKTILTDMLTDENANVREGAALALARPNADDLDRIIEILIEGITRGQFRIPCAIALGDLGPAAAEAIPDLERAAHSSSGGYVISTAARNALKKIKVDLED